MPKTMRGMARPEGAGRKKGTPNKKTQTLLEKCEEIGCDPFEVLMRFAAGDWKGLGYKCTCYASNPKCITAEDNLPAHKKTKCDCEPISKELRQKSAKDACEYVHPKRKALEIETNGETGFKIVVQDYSGKSELRSKIQSL